MISMGRTTIDIANLKDKIVEDKTNTIIGNFLLGLGSACGAGAVVLMVLYWLNVR